MSAIDTAATMITELTFVLILSTMPTLLEG